ncbi:DUF6261 family protein [uncultured Draconibacterium sp.]|uniref:DUF6261 family protein n=1 Tax=uncultured Draconibacterium sp. TaxID=1573823 RepID=UPI003217FF08
MIPLLMIRSYNTEVDGTSTQIIQSYDATTLNTDVSLEQIMTALKAESALLSAAIGRIKEKSEQKANDEIRDEKITGLYYLLLSFSHHPDEEIRNAALSLLEIFDHYGLAIKDESYTRESSLVHSMLDDLAKPKALASIALVPQCAEYIAALQLAQDNFEATRLSYESAQAEEGTLGNATKLKKEVVTLLNGQLVPYLNVVSQLNDTMYGALARTIAQLIEANNEVVKKRNNTGGEPDAGD